MKRQRGRNRGGGSPNKPQQNVNRAFDSNGPDNVKIRGHAQHVFEKYQQLARDAFSGGDRVLAENYLQHADHYFRVLRTLQPQRPASEILGRDVFASGLDIDFEDEGEGYDEASDAGGEGGEANGAEPGRSEFRADARYENRQGYERQGSDRQGNERQGNERQNNERQGYDRQNYDRQEPRRDDRFEGRRDNQDNRVDTRRNDGRTDAGGGDRDARRDNGRDNGRRFETRNNRDDRFRDDRPREERFRDDRSRDDRPRDDRRYEPRVDAERSDQAQEAVPRTTVRGLDPVTAMVSEPPALAPAPGEDAESSPLLRSEDGGVSEAPAFLQAAVGGASADEAADTRRPRARRRRPRAYEGGEEGGEAMAPETAEEA